MGDRTFPTHAAYSIERPDTWVHNSSVTYLSRRYTSETGAGEGIRTLDPNLGKVVLYP